MSRGAQRAIAAGRRRPVLGAAVGVAFLIAVLILGVFAAGGSAQGSCSAANPDVWQLTSGTGDWNTAGNWSTGLPSGSTDVCLPAGSYTVTIDGESESAGSVEIGAGASLKVEGDSGGASLNVGGGTVTNEGTLQLTDLTADVNDNVGVYAGTIDNSGVLQSDAFNPAVTGAREIGASLVNTGTVALDVTSSLDQTGGTYENEAGGTISIASGQTLSINTADGQGGFDSTHVFDLDGGTITNNGTFLDPGGTFNHNGGTVTGNPIDLQSVALNASLDGGSGSGSATFYAFGTSGTLTGNVAAGDTVEIASESGLNNVSGDSTETLAGSLTNAGTIELTNSSSSNAWETQLLGASSAVTLTNTGAIETLPGNDGGLRELGVNLTNRGTVTIDAASRLDQTAGVYDNEAGGTITIDAGQTLSVTSPDGDSSVDSGHVVNLDGGSIIDTGNFVDPGGTFNHNGGTATGNPITLQFGVSLNPSLDGGTGSGSATFLVEGLDTLIGNVASTDTLQVAAADLPNNGGAVLSASGDLTNAGTIELTSVSSGQPWAVELQDPSGTLTNTGEIQTLPGSVGGTRTLSLSDLANVGTLDLQTPTSFSDGAGTLTQSSGSTDLESSGGLDLTGSSDTFTLDGGTVSGTGTLTGTLDNVSGTVSPGSSSTPGTLTISGAYEQASGGTLAIAVNGTGAGSFSALSVQGSPTLDGTLSIQPGTTYAGAAASGDTFAVLPYTGTLTGTFASTVVSPQNTVLPIITTTGTPSIGSTLSCSQGSWTNGPTKFAYQWNRDGSPIAGATASTYLISQADVGHSISCTVTASGGAPLAGGLGFAAHYNPAVVDAVVGSSFTAGTTSATSAGQTVSSAPYNTALPAISGAAQVGSQLSCSTGSWLYAPSSYTYQWRRAGQPIAGAITSTYTLAGADGGQSVSCAVTATNVTGSAVAVSGAVSVPVPIIPVTVSQSTLPAATGANAYSQAFTACGGAPASCEHYSTSASSLVDASGAAVSAANAYTFAVASGTLPPGLSLSSAGLLSGTPTQAGSYTFAVRATDPKGASGQSVSLTLSVLPGLSITSNEGFSLGGSIPTGTAVIAPGTSTPITSVSMSSAGHAYVPVAGAPATGPADVGVQVSTAGGTCTTSLQIAGSDGVLFSASGLLTSGCSTTTTPTGTTVAGLREARPAAAGLREARLAAAGRVTTPPAFATASPGTVTATGAFGTVSGTVNSNGTFLLTIPASAGNGPFRVTVSGGSYTSELDSSNQSTAFSLSSAVDGAASLPQIITVTPITTLVDSLAQGVAAGTSTLAGPHASAAANIFSAYGFPSGNTAETVIPSFASGASGAAANALAGLGALEGEAAQLGTTDRGSVVTALTQEIQDGAFGSVSSTLPTGFGTGTLPTAAGTAQFLGGLTSFSDPTATSIPPLPAAASGIKQTLPVAVTPLPVPTATLTRIGPAAFAESITASGPATAKTPFSSGSDTFTVEVVGGN